MPAAHRAVTVFRRRSPGRLRRDLRPPDVILRPRKPLPVSHDVLPDGEKLLRHPDPVIPRFVRPLKNNGIPAEIRHPMPGSGWRGSGIPPAAGPADGSFAGAHSAPMPSTTQGTGHGGPPLVGTGAAGRFRIEPGEISGAAPGPCRTGSGSAEASATPAMNACAHPGYARHPHAGVRPRLPDGRARPARAGR